MTTASRPTGTAAKPLDVAGLLATKKWTTEDMPWMDYRLWDKLLDIFGAANFHIIESAQEGSQRCGRFLLHSKARRNLRLRKKEFSALAKELLPA